MSSSVLSLYLGVVSHEYKFLLHPSFMFGFECSFSLSSSDGLWVDDRSIHLVLSSLVDLQLALCGQTSRAKCKYRTTSSKSFLKICGLKLKCHCSYRTDAIRSNAPNATWLLVSRHLVQIFSQSSFCINFCCLAIDLYWPFEIGFLQCLQSTNF
jgi:hypothetical protein